MKVNQITTSMKKYYITATILGIGFLLFLYMLWLKGVPVPQI